MLAPPPMRLLRLFGPPSLEGPSPSEIPAHRPAWLLFVLAYRGDWVDRDELLTLFWAERDERGARHGLRLWLSRARRVAWADGLEVGPRRVRWAPPTDVAAFRDAVARGDWATALAWHRAPLLTGIAVPDLPALHAWLQAEREELLGVARRAALAEARRLGAIGAHDGAVAVLDTAASLDPLDEALVGATLAHALRGGDRETALRRFDHFERRLRGELDAAPSDATMRLARAVEDAPDRPVTTHDPSLDRSTDVRPPFLVGRETAVTALRSSNAPLTVVVGEAGAGKTHLLRACLPSARWLTCSEATRRVPFASVTSLALESPALVAALGPYADDVRRLLPEVDAGCDAATPVDDVVATARLFEGLARLLEHDARPLVVDDLHWADPMTLDLVALIAARGRARVIVAMRSGELDDDLEARVAALRASVPSTELHVPRLGPEDVVRWLDAVSSDGAPATDVAAWLHARTGGNPLFVVETLSMLADDGTLHRDGSGRLRLANPLDLARTSRVPPGVRDVIGRRLDALAGVARQVVDLAAVAGDVWDVDRLASVLALPHATVAAALDHLERHAMIDGARFSHDLVRATAYDRIGTRTRRHLHGLVARALEADADAAAYDGWRAAEHWERAGDRQRAAAAFARAAERASAMGWWRPALAAAERSLDLAPSHATRQRVITALVALGLGDAADAHIGVLEGDGDPIWRIHGHVARTHQSIRTGHLDRALTAGRRAADAITSLGVGDVEPSLQLEALLALANAAALSGTQATVVDRLDRTLTELAGQLPARLLAQGRSNLAWLHAGLGDFERALRLYDEALQVALTANDRYWRAWIAANALYCHLEVGDPRPALLAAEDALDDQPSDAQEILRINLAKAYLDLGRTSDATRLLEELLSTSLDPSNRAVAFGYLTDLYAAGGEPERSRAALAQAVALLEATQLDRARVRVAIALARHGDANQRLRAAALVPGLRRGAVPGYVWREFEVAVRVAGSRAAPLDRVS